MFGRGEKPIYGPESPEEKETRLREKDAKMDALFANCEHLDFTSVQKTPAGELVDQLMVEGVDPLVIELIPDSVACLVEKAAEGPDFWAPPPRHPL